MTLLEFLNHIKHKSLGIRIYDEFTHELYLDTCIG